MSCCRNNNTERHDSRDERVAALRRTLDDARAHLTELERDEEDAA